MPQSTFSPSPSARPTLRLVGEEERPTYDAAPARSGFAMIPAAVFDLRNADCIAVYAVIAKHADRQTGECYPSLETICGWVGLSKPTVIKVIKRLEEAGVLACERRFVHGMNAATLYRIPANVRQSTEFTAQSTGFTQAVKQVYSGGKAGLPKQEPGELEPEEQEKTPLDSPTKRDAYPADFEEFWRGYPKGHGSKKASAGHWRRMSAEDRAAAVAALPQFRAGRAWRDGFVKDCERWLRDRLWENPPEPADPVPGIPARGPHAFTLEEERAFRRSIPLLRGPES